MAILCLKFFYYLYLQLKVQSTYHNQAVFFLVSSYTCEFSFPPSMYALLQLASAPPSPYRILVPFQILVPFRFKPHTQQWLHVYTTW